MYWYAEGLALLCAYTGGEASAHVTLPLEDVGDSMHSTYAVRDLWSRTNVSCGGNGCVKEMAVDVPGHGVRLMRMWPLPPVRPKDGLSAA